MADVIFLAITLAFFGVCVAFVRGCERLMAGSTEDESLLEDAHP